MIHLFKSLSKQVTQADLESGRLYPAQKQIPEVSVKVACDITKWYYQNGKATTYPEPVDKESFIRSHLYDTTYNSYVPKTWKWPEEHSKPRSYDKVE